MSQHVKAALLDVIDEGNEAHAAARVGNHQKYLRPPELDMVLSHIQHQQVLAYLKRKEIHAIRKSVEMCVYFLLVI